MTKKDYIKLAAAVRMAYKIAEQDTSKSPDVDYAFKVLLFQLGVTLEADNANFDADKFVKAVGISS